MPQVRQRQVVVQEPELLCRPGALPGVGTTQLPDKVDVGEGARWLVSRVPDERPTRRPLGLAPGRERERPEDLSAAAAREPHERDGPPVAYPCLCRRAVQRESLPAWVSGEEALW